ASGARNEAAHSPDRGPVLSGQVLGFIRRGPSPELIGLSPRLSLRSVRDPLEKIHRVERLAILARADIELAGIREGHLMGGAVGPGEILVQVVGSKLGPGDLSGPPDEGGAGLVGCRDLSV